MFQLHPRLRADTVPLGCLALSALLLMNDARYPWLILVPQRPDLREIFDLAAGERSLLLDEIVEVSRFVSDSFRVDKLNIAALGNLVPQLHVHVIGRRVGDAAWPLPVWGRGEAVPYAADALATMIAAVRGLPGLVPPA